MRETLFIQIHPTARGQARWLTVDASGKTGPIASGLVGQAVNPDERRRVVLIVPGECVTLTSVAIPGRNSKQIERAIPFALEEQLADDLDEVHFSIGKRSANGKIPVAVVKHANMGNWLDQLRDAGAEAQLIVPDILCLPAPGDDQCTVLAEGERIIARLDDNTGFVCEPDMLPVLLLPETRVDGHLCGDTASLATTLPEHDVRQTSHDHSLPVLAEYFDSASVLNLLHGNYIKQSQWLEKIKPWRLAAVLACLAIAFELIFRGVAVYQLDQKNQLLDQQITAIFKKTLPNVKRIVNPRIQMEQALNNLQNGSSGSGALFLAVLDDTAEVLGKFEDLELKNLSFRENAIELQISGNNVALADQLKASFSAAPRLSAELKSVNSQGNQVDIRLRVQARIAEPAKS